MIGNAPQALQFVSAVSRKTHGSAGTFDVQLPLSGTPAVECRQRRQSHVRVHVYEHAGERQCDFNQRNRKHSGTPTFSGQTMTVNVSGVANAQLITVKLSGVKDQFAQVLPDTTVTVRLLAGDVNGNGAVNATDVSQAKSQVGQTVGSANFNSDVNCSGSINATDVSLIKASVGTGAP